MLAAPSCHQPAESTCTEQFQEKEARNIESYSAWGSEAIDSCGLTAIVTSLIQ